MHMGDPAGVEKHETVEEHALVALFDEAYGDLHVAYRVSQLSDGRRIVEPHSHSAGEVEQAVAGERELGKHQQIDTLPPRPLDPLQVLGEIGVDIAQSRVDLGEADCQLRRHGRDLVAGVERSSPEGGPLC